MNKRTVRLDPNADRATVTAHPTGMMSVTTTSPQRAVSESEYKKVTSPAPEQPSPEMLSAGCLVSLQTHRRGHPAPADC